MLGYRNLLPPETGLGEELLHFQPHVRGSLDRLAEWLDEMDPDGSLRRPRHAAYFIPGAAPIIHDADAKTIRRGRAYLATLPPSIEGQNGSAAMYYAARALVHGFCLSQSDAMPLLLEYNARAEPPWSVRELEHKLAHAAERPFGKPRGWLLQGGAA